MIFLTFPPPFFVSNEVAQYFLMILFSYQTNLDFQLNFTPRKDQLSSKLQFVVIFTATAIIQLSEKQIIVDIEMKKIFFKQTRNVNAKREIY